MKVVLIGSGNVATNLGTALRASGIEILQVWSRNALNAQTLANRLGATSISDLALLSPEADIYLISVIDDAIPLVAAEFKFPDKLLVHTSGTTGIETLKNASRRNGVLYPIQTFSKNRAVDFLAIPIAVEASSPEDLGTLISLAAKISRKVIQLNCQQRKALHIAAVFACNFSNHLYTLGKEILESNELDFDLIRPLILETADKVQEMEPEEAQTGPAIRQDNLIIQRHLEFLQSDNKLKQLYELFTESIISKQRSQ